MINIVAPSARPSPYLPDISGLARAGRTRLFCFHYAGGTASAFASWRDRLSPQIALLPVQLPGREYRVHDRRILAMDRLLEELVRDLRPMLDAPFALYGHSMGAMIAYAFARHLRDHGGPAPSALLLGACPPPDTTGRSAHAEIPDRAALVHWMRELGGVPDALLQYPEWLEASVALLRDDLVLASTYRPPPSGPLSCPVHVLAGARDPVLPPARAGEWAEHTTGPFTTHTVPGGHFFLREHPDELVHLVNNLLRQPFRA